MVITPAKRGYSFLWVRCSYNDDIIHSFQVSLNFRCLFVMMLSKFGDHRPYWKGVQTGFLRHVILKLPTSTHLNNRNWVNNSTCICLLNLVVIELIKVEVSTLTLILIEYLRNNWTHRLESLYWDIFKIRNTDIWFRSPEKVSTRKESEI